MSVFEPGYIICSPYSVTKWGETYRVGIVCGQDGLAYPLWSLVLIYPNGYEKIKGVKPFSSLPEARTWLDTNHQSLYKFI